MNALVRSLSLLDLCILTVCQLESLVRAMTMSSGVSTLQAQCRAVMLTPLQMPVSSPGRESSHRETE